MTVAESSSITSNTSEIVAELIAGNNIVDAMIGIGIVKDSEAVYFEYVGDKETIAITDPRSGKPVKKFGNVLLNGLSIAEDVGEFKSTKLNIYLQTGQGRTLMLTSGLNTIWSQCVLTGLMEIWNQGKLDSLISIDTWKGNSKMKPCFAAVKIDEKKFSDTHMYEQLREARSMKDSAKVMNICRDAVELLNHAINNEPDSILEVSLADATTTTNGDF